MHTLARSSLRPFLFRSAVLSTRHHRRARRGNPRGMATDDVGLRTLRRRLSSKDAAVLKIALALLRGGAWASARRVCFACICRIARGMDVTRQCCLAAWLIDCWVLEIEVGIGASFSASFDCLAINQK